MLNFLIRKSNWNLKIILTERKCAITWYSNGGIFINYHFIFLEVFPRTKKCALVDRMKFNCISFAVLSSGWKYFLWLNQIELLCINRCSNLEQYFCVACVTMHRCLWPILFFRRKDLDSHHSMQRNRLWKSNQ